MTILFISNRSNLSKQEALQFFASYSEHNDFQYFKNISSAKKFLADNLIEKDKHIDFIIADWQFKNENSKNLLNWLRESRKDYSSGNFQLKSIPFLLIEDRKNQSANISDGFDAIIENFPNNDVNLNYNITSVIKTWRTKLADDLELIGLNPKTQEINFNHRKSFLSYYKLKVLSKKFVDQKSKKLNYIWTNTNYKNIFDSNHLFEQKMRKTLKHPTKYLEKEIHDFLRKHPTFIKGENYKNFLYEKHLYINNSRRYNEADFINTPYEYALRFPEIFEVKRQSQRIFWKNKDQILSKAKKGFKQVIRYKKYMESNNPANEYYIKKYLGKLYSKYEYTLLMGSNEEERYNENLVEELKNDFNFNEINLVTYEDLLDKHVRLCDRLNELNIF